MATEVGSNPPLRSASCEPTSPMAAAEKVIAALHEMVGGTGGVIVLDRDGRPGHARSTETMSWAFGSSAGERDSGC